MNNVSMKNNKLMTNGKISNSVNENKRLRDALKKAVRKEKASADLREKISRMIREN